jgi:cytochrome c-type biogenesis protein CcmH/NrfG
MRHCAGVARYKKVVQVIRSFRLPLVLAAILVALASAGTSGAWAAPKATPAPTASPTPAAAPSPLATVEPLAQAIPRLEAKLKVDPNDKATMSELAQDYYNASRPDLTLALTTKLIAGGTKTAQLYYLDGIANYAVGRLNEALADLQNASNLEPTNSAVLGALTSMLVRANRPADAERAAKRAVTFNPKDKDALVAYGRVLASEQKFDDARTQYEAAAALDTTDANPVVLEAQTYMAQNAVALAQQVFDRAVTIDPKNQEALAGKAQVEGVAHNVKDAIATFGQLLALQTSDDERAVIVDQMAKLYAIEKMTGDADATYKKAIADYPKVPSTHLAYGDYLMFIKDTAGAEREWTTAAGPNRDYPEALGRLGEYYASKNDLPKTIDAYKRLTEVSSQDPRGFLLLGQAYGAHKEFAKAREAFKTSYTLGHTPESLLGLAQADFEMRNYKECSSIYNLIDHAAPQLTKQNPQILFLLGQCYQKGGDISKAHDAYSRLMPLLKTDAQRKQVAQVVRDMDAANKPKPKATTRAAAKPQAAATAKPTPAPK